MKRPARLQAGKVWLQGFGGRRLVRAYARWFGVDRLCAIKELQMLGVEFRPEQVQEVERSVAQRTAARRQARSRATESEAARVRQEAGWWDEVEDPRPADPFVLDTERELPF